MRARGWMALGVALALGAGCAEHEAQVTHPGADEAMAALLAVEPQQPLARVAEVGVDARELELFWEANPELDRAEAMEALIEQTLLMQEAHRRGLHRTPDASFARKQGLTNAFLEREIESAVERAQPDESFLRLLGKNAAFPEGYRSSHLVIVVPRQLPGDERHGAERRRELREARFERARAWIEMSAERLGERPDVDALVEEAQRLNASVLPEGYQAVVNAQMRFAKPDEGDVSQRLPAGWIQVVPEFSRAADAMANEAALGSLSAPVRSPVGWHLLKVDERLEGQPADPDALRRFAVHALTREARAQGYTDALSALLDEARVELRPERLQDEVPGQ